jgi:hypothetical protein
METAEEIEFDLEKYYMEDSDKVVNYQTKLAYYFHVAEWKPDGCSTSVGFKATLG